MCLFKIRVRGCKILGRQLYRTDAGVKLGYSGPQVSLEEAVSQLSLTTSCNVLDNVNAIDRRIIAGEIKDSSGLPYQVSDEFINAAAARDPMFSENGYAPLSMLPPDVACREDENGCPEELCADTPWNNTPADEPAELSSVKVEACPF